jgi:hypothetical protein
MPKDYSIGYKFKGDASGYKRAMVEMNQSTKQFANTMAETKKTLIGSAAALAVLRFSVNSMKLAAEAEGIRTAFMRLGDSRKILEEIRIATRGVIDNEELMGLAIKAQNFNIPLKDLAKMLEFSSTRAVTAGKSISEFADKFVTGVGRRMPKSLIELQISAADAKAMFSHSGLGGVLEYVNGQLEKMGDVADTSTIRFGKFSAAIGNLKQSWGDFLNNTELVKKSIEGISFALQNIADRGLLNTLFEGKNSHLAVFKKNQGGGYLDRLLEKSKWDVDRNGNAIIPPPNAIPKPVQDLSLLKKAADEAAKALERLKTANEKIWSGSAMKETEKYFMSTSNIGASTHAKQTKGGLATWGWGRTGAIEGEQKSIEDANNGIIEGIQIVNSLQSAFESLFANTGNGFKGMAESFGNALKQMAAEMAAKAAIFGILTLLTGGTGALAGWAGKVLGGASFGKFMGFAGGTNFAPGGLSMVGERGPELVNLPRGSQVIPMGNQGINIQVAGTTRIRGRDLEIAWRRI